jgi:hypothetical protein
MEESIEEKMVGHSWLFCTVLRISDLFCFALLATNEHYPRSWL